MWQKETNYKFALKKNLIFDFCQNAYKDNLDYDMVFITKDKSSIPAHRVILALFSGIFKEMDAPVEMLTLHLPDFTSSVVTALITFLYSGTVVIDSSLRDDFISLASSLCINFPEEILEIPPVTAEPAIVKVEEDQYMILDDDYEQDFAADLEPDEESFEEPDDDSTSYQNETYEDASPTRHSQLKKVNTKSENKPQNSFDNPSPSSAMPHANIQEALADIANGLNTMEAARRYGIPKTTLYRWAKKTKVK